MMEVLLPATLQELWEIYDVCPQGVLMAGGTDLLVRLRKEAVQPPLLICLEKIAELQVIRDEGARFFLGAGVTHQKLLSAEAIADKLPLLPTAAGQLGSPPIRHSGTIGGNLCSASPAGDLLPALYLLDGVVEIRGKNSARSLPMADFILGPGKTALHPGEIVTGVTVAAPPAGAASAYYKVGKRKALAIAVVSLAAVWSVARDGKIADIKLAWGSVGPTVIRLPEVEGLLAGKALSTETLQQAAQMVYSRLTPIDDLRASAEYRRKVAGNLLLKLAWPAQH